MPQTSNIPIALDIIQISSSISIIVVLLTDMLTAFLLSRLALYSSKNRQQSTSLLYAKSTILQPLYLRLQGPSKYLHMPSKHLSQQLQPLIYQFNYLRFSYSKQSSQHLNLSSLREAYLAEFLKALLLTFIQLYQRLYFAVYYCLDSI